MTAEQLNEISYGISYNSGISNKASEVYVDGGNIHRKISIGDRMNISVDGTSVAVNLIGFKHDELANSFIYGANREMWSAGMTFQTVDCWRDTHKMNESGTNVGGWETSAMRTYMTTLLGLASTDFKNVIKGVNKRTSIGNKSATIATTEDKLFLLSEIEIFGTAGPSFAGEGEQYAYYKAGNSKIKKLDGNAQHWWERSPERSTNSFFCLVFDTGISDYSVSTNAFGVAFAFCI